MKEWEASQEEKAFLEEAAGSPWEGEGTEVSAAKDKDKALNFQSARSQARNLNYPITVFRPPTKQEGEYEWAAAKGVCQNTIQFK